VNLEISISVNHGMVDLRVGADIYGLTPDVATKIGIALTHAAQKARPYEGSGK